MRDEIKRPNCCENKHLDFLDDFPWNSSRLSHMEISAVAKEIIRLNFRQLKEEEIEEIVDFWLEGLKRGEVYFPGLSD